MKRVKIFCSDERNNDEESPLARGLEKIDKLERRRSGVTKKSVYQIADYGSILTVLDDDETPGWRRRIKNTIVHIGANEGYAAVHLDCKMAKIMAAQGGAEYNLDFEMMLDQRAAVEFLKLVAEVSAECDIENFETRIYLQDHRDDTFAYLFNGEKFDRIALPN